MGYYYVAPYQFTDHGLQRCRERLHLGPIDDFALRKRVLDLIKNSPKQFETRADLYFQVPQSQDLYFVIDKATHVVITCTPVSLAKQMQLLDLEEQTFDI